MLNVIATVISITCRKNRLSCCPRSVPETEVGWMTAPMRMTLQVELYRTRTANERRAGVGLQPNRAEVILAGACVVRVVLTKLDCDSLVVSDRGVRHWLIADRFGLGPPSAER
jgi:exopolyphosphatase/guanosine-5'-triphosphate,3'-diphosphate pyrophosphatase